MARTSFTRSEVGKAPSSGVMSLAARCSSCRLSSALRAPFALANASRRRTRSLVGQAFGELETARATAPTTAARLGAFVEATASWSKVVGARGERSAFEEKVETASEKLEEEKPLSPRQRITDATCSTDATGARACNLVATSSKAAPAVAKVFRVATCSFALGSGCVPSRTSSTEEAKVLATSGQLAAPAFFTRSRASSTPISATMPSLKLESIASREDAPGSLKILERREELKMDFDFGSCLKMMSATAA
mmetsp:Transcript_1124/g.2475  ORF Transcript_1124/g.2475 Transcript_1124/m.2475 type:complete len:251 (-) Transcript_1124:1581-2333(-)